jgi:ubiquinone/menaquinone biosynthesis C-methylase UbiE
MSAEDAEATTPTDEVWRLPGYVDPKYLETVAPLWEYQKRRSYELLRLQPGHRVLDFGCGPATDTIDLADMVGPTGVVIGVDHDPAMVALANQRAEAAGVHGWTTHVQADALSLPFDAASFDRVRAERVFQHLPRPEAAFAELVRVCRSGGWIGVLEPDWGTLSIDSTQVDLERRYVRFFIEGYLPNGYAGRRLYRLFVSHQLDDIVMEVYPVYFTNFAFTQYALLADRVEPAAVAAGALTQGEVDKLRQEWQQADAEGRFFASMHGIGAYGRKT